jgi:hypothetical protein
MCIGYGDLVEKQSEYDVNGALDEELTDREGWRTVGGETADGGCERDRAAGEGRRKPLPVDEKLRGWVIMAEGCLDLSGTNVENEEEVGSSLPFEEARQPTTPGVGSPLRLAGS